jgi:hypothetical protein
MAEDCSCGDLLLNKPIRRYERRHSSSNPVNLVNSCQSFSRLVSSDGGCASRVGDAHNEIGSIIVKTTLGKGGNREAISACILGFQVYPVNKAGLKHPSPTKKLIPTVRVHGK